MSYLVTLKKPVIKVLEEMSDPHYSLIKKSIYMLVDNTRPIGCKKLKNRIGYGIRVGDYRIIYDVFDDVLIVNVIALGHRKDVYD